MSVIENGTEIDTFHNEEQAFDLGGMEFSTLERFVLISYVVILITFSIASNAWVILAVIKCKPLKIIPNYYLVSLSCSDILMATLVMPLALHYNLAGVWRHGVIACKVICWCELFISWCLECQHKLMSDILLRLSGFCRSKNYLFCSGCLESEFLFYLFAAYRSFKWTKLNLYPERETRQGVAC